MKTICYIIPYFGKLPINFELWLNSCATNPTVNWLIFTNDKRKFNYPKNVKVEYMEFDTFKSMVQKHFDFEVDISYYHRISLYKPVYGELFAEYIKDYDFWGYCDVDLIWGNIRKFITDDILNKYERIGFQGHSTIYKNIKKVNSRYKTIVPNKINYKDVFSGKTAYSFDEDTMDDIYNYLNIEYYKEVNFAHLDLISCGFYLGHLPKKDEYKNKYQVFIWDSGNLYRKYVHKNKIFTEEYMYLHFFTRPMTYKQKQISKESKYLIYADEVVDLKDLSSITIRMIKNKGKKKPIRFIIKKLYLNRHKITWKRLKNNFRFIVLKDRTYRG